MAAAPQRVSKLLVSTASTLLRIREVVSSNKTRLEMLLLISKTILSKIKLPNYRHAAVKPTTITMMRSDTCSRAAFTAAAITNTNAIVKAV
jgi:hypothetical protein